MPKVAVKKDIFFPTKEISNSLLPFIKEKLYIKLTFCMIHNFKNNNKEAKIQNIDGDRWRCISINNYIIK